MFTSGRLHPIEKQYRQKPKTAYANRTNQNVVLFYSNLDAKKNQFLLQGKKGGRDHLILILGDFLHLLQY